MKDTFKHKGLRNKLAFEVKAKGVLDIRVLKAIESIPRHLFMDSSFVDHAYQDKAFPIGAGQTISQPYIVAKMTELLISHTKARGKILDNVLELGTGCGYQTAVLSYFCENIYSIERIKPLVNKARENLSELKIRNVELIYGDGFEDYDNTIKYDGVICAAAPREYPYELVDSLNISAKIVIPVGNSKSQKLNVINKISSNEVEQDLYDDVSFVPMLPGKSEDGLDS